MMSDSAPGHTDLMVSPEAIDDATEHLSYTVNLTLPEWMVEKLTALALEQKVDPRALILQAIGEFLTTR